MNPALQALVDRAADRRLVPGIYNYCNSRCERCPFTERCLTFLDDREREARHPENGALECVKDALLATVASIEAWCEREGIDFEEVQRAGSEESAAAESRADDMVSADPLHHLARTYMRAGFEIIDALQKSAPFHAWGAEVHEAVDAIAWHVSMISAKTSRALHGRARQTGDDLEWDEVQNDWNGSAKVARVAIAESIVAWLTLIDEGQAPAGSPIRDMPALLGRIDAALAERFPRAMDFVRPGFDEPDVAAGALTSLAPFEPGRSPIIR